MFDRQQATRHEPATGQRGDRADHRHPVRAAEQGVCRVMLGHFRFQLCPGGDVGRVAHHEVDGTGQLGKQPGRGDVGRHQFDGGAGRVAPCVFQCRGVVVDRDDAGAGPTGGQRDGQRAGTGTQVDDHRRVRQALGDNPFQH